MSDELLSNDLPDDAINFKGGIEKLLLLKKIFRLAIRARDLPDESHVQQPLGYRGCPISQ